MTTLLEQLRCPCCGREELDELLVPMLKELEKKVGTLRITSGFRCEKHNEELKKRGLPVAEKSLHLVGKAADIFCLKKHQAALVDAARKAGFGGIGIGANFIHLDLGESREWKY